MDGMGTAHYLRRSGDELERHEGPSEKCPAPECAWPRIGEMVTVISRGRKVTGSLAEKVGNAVVVKTADGKLHQASRVSVTRPEWGVYCAHGTKVVEAEPAEHTCHLPDPPCDLAGTLGHLCIDHKKYCPACYPSGRKILPWRCGEEGCSEADFDREQQEAEEEYWESMRREAYGF
jgi:hypothetical protein